MNWFPARTLSGRAVDGMAMLSTSSASSPQSHARGLPPSADTPEEADNGRGRDLRRYRIAFIGGRGVGHLYSGVETFYEEAGSRLVSRGHEVTIYCRPHFVPHSDRYRGMRIECLPAPRSKHFETLIHSFL